MYIKNTNVHEVYFKNKVLLVNLNNGQWVRTSRKYFEVLNKLVESNQIGDFMKYKYVSNVIDNLKRLFNELLEIRYYVDEEKTYKENTKYYFRMYSLSDYKKFYREKFKL